MSALSFDAEASFCPVCGALLRNMPESGQSVRCLACKKELPLEVFATSELHYVIEFNHWEKKRVQDEPNDDEVDGPTVERRCPKCGHDTMAWAALQLRSADEGQTIFFTCLKCKFKETENS